jgi:hypothetical protein
MEIKLRSPSAELNHKVEYYEITLLKIIEYYEITLLKIIAQHTSQYKITEQQIPYFWIYMRGSQSSQISSSDVRSTFS